MCRSRKTLHPCHKRQRLCVVVPAEEGQFHANGTSSRVRSIVGHQRPAERIADLKVVLAAAYLADIPPSRRRIIPERVVHPFVDFVARDGTSCVPEPEISARIVIHDPPGLSGAALRGMEARMQQLLTVGGSAPDCTSS